MTIGAPRRQHRAHLEMRECDYHLLEAAASTTLRRLGLCGVWPIEDLIDVGWERVFFYDATYERFEKYGYLHAIREMAKHIHATEADALPLLSEEHEHTLAGLVDPGTPAEAIERTEEIEQARAQAARLLACLSDRERAVVMERMQDWSWRKVGRRHRVSCETARIWYRQAYEKLLTQAKRLERTDR